MSFAICCSTGHTGTLFGWRCGGCWLGIFLLRPPFVTVGEDGVEAGLDSGNSLGEEGAPSTRGRHCSVTSRDVWRYSIIYP
jgi:hypothetical protein